MIDEITVYKAKRNGYLACVREVLPVFGGDLEAVIEHAHTMLGEQADGYAHQDYERYAREQLAD